MRSLLLFALITLLSSCHRNIRNDCPENVLTSEYDTIRCSEPIKGKARVINYTNSICGNRGTNLVIDSDGVMLGYDRNKVREGRYYFLDTNNSLISIVYYINNQKIYFHDFSESEIYNDNILSIADSNIQFIDPPILICNDIGNSILKIRATSRNYPLVLTALSLYPPNTGLVSDIKRDFVEESMIFNIKIKQEPVHFAIVMKNKHDRELKRFEYLYEAGKIRMK